MSANEINLTLEPIQPRTRPRVPFASIDRQRSSLAASFVLHLLVGGLLLTITKTNPVEIPFGSFRKGDPTVVEVSLAPSAPAKSIPASKPLNASEGTVIVKKKVTEALPAPVAAPASSTPNSGFANGTETSGPIGRNDGFDATIRERYLYELRHLITSRKVYPSASRRLGETGRVVVQFTINKNGLIESAAIKSPSSSERLNEAALALVSGVSKFKPFPAEESAEKLPVEVPIDYVLD